MTRPHPTACLTLMCLLILPLAATAGDPVYEADAIVGIWSTEPNDDDAYSQVEVYSKDGKYEGRIVWLSSPVYADDEPEGEAGTPRLDHRNTDEALRGRPLMGMVLMIGFEHNGKNKWEDGRLYDPESGKTYDGKFTMKDPDTLELFGYVKVGFAKLGRNSRWTRVIAGEVDAE